MHLGASLLQANIGGLGGGATGEPGAEVQGRRPRRWSEELELEVEVEQGQGQGQEQREGED